MTFNVERKKKEYRIDSKKFTWFVQLLYHVILRSSKLYYIKYKIVIRNYKICKLHFIKWADTKQLINKTKCKVSVLI